MSGRSAWCCKRADCLLHRHRHRHLHRHLHGATESDSSLSCHCPLLSIEHRRIHPSLTGTEMGRARAREEEGKGNHTVPLTIAKYNNGEIYLLSAICHLPSIFSSWRTTWTSGRVCMVYVVRSLGRRERGINEYQCTTAEHILQQS